MCEIVEDSENGETGINFLYDNWEKIKWTKTDSFTRDDKVTILEKYGDLPVPTKTGYDFKGWYFDREYTKEVRSNDIVEITSDTTVYAK